MDAITDPMNGVRDARPQGRWSAVAGSIPAGQRLTIGVIARNGLPFLEDCLASLPPEGAFAGELHLVLVDSASEDGTTATMTAFAAARRDTEVHRIEGQANAAVARNVVLANAPPGYLMMLDGDMVLNPAFIADGVARIRAGEAEAVVGALREQRFDADNRPDGEEIWRHAPDGPTLVHLSGGALLLGPAARRDTLRYDETQKICEDWDFAMRLSRHARLLRVPENMALHLTHYYFSPQRRLDFYRDLRPRNLGSVLRKHLGNPRGVMEMIRRERGVFLGGGLQAAIIVALLAGAPLAAAAAAALLAVDAVRSARHGKSPEWVGTRLFAPWLVLLGVIVPPAATVRYRVRPLSPRPETTAA